MQLGRNEAAVAQPACLQARSGTTLAMQLGRNEASRRAYRRTIVAFIFSEAFEQFGLFHRRLVSGSGLPLRHLKLVDRIPLKHSHVSSKAPPPRLHTLHKLH
eukprot:scaffold253305_cov27-Tisochrysis_lutea.AAC.1